MNPVALNLWALTGITGYLISGTVRGALIGLAVGLSASLFAEIWSK